MTKIDNFPYMSACEFENTCTDFLKRFEQTSRLHSEWTSVEHLDSFNTKYLRITKPLQSSPSHAVQTSKALATNTKESDEEACEIEDDDNEVLRSLPAQQALICYDIILSPTYSVPALYISVKDPLHRYPPTLSTLYNTIIPPEYAAQTKDFGVIGGVTITDHPIKNTPVYFLHPCKVAEVLQASCSRASEIDTASYLLLWIGAMGKCVGLDVPLALVAS
ncbi:hypothetical protein P280DRAFT_417931 [Massarina eburnea CBS 473.64]|uniref:Ubiquitin-like-conjugating enzyme ATG10 n=1 Tax=Massarina eburnea CBS 473.64 TaxID=1395130 RepID=A0A6A6SE56_9PLEO|nr:hypothetical protein P280DRAFT_417931 [Massarina eburnea CBS 473.64]